MRLTLGDYYAAGGQGDKKLVYCTDVINSVPPYPVFEGEKYVGLVYKYTLVDQKYKLFVMKKYCVMWSIRLMGQAERCGNNT